MQKETFFVNPILSKALQKVLFCTFLRFNYIFILIQIKFSALGIVAYFLEMPKQKMIKRRHL